MEIVETLPSWSYRQWQVAEENMREFNAGTRKENVKACGYDKLEAYYKICCDKNLDIARQKIEDELARRDHNNGTTIGPTIIAKYKKVANPTTQSTSQPTPQSTQSTNTTSTNTSSTGDYDTIISMLRANPSKFNRDEAVQVNNNRNKPEAVLEYAKYKPSTQQALVILMLLAVAMRANNVANAIVEELKTRFSWPISEIQRVAGTLMKDSSIMAAIMASVKGLTEDLNEEVDEEGLMETVEKHDTLNPKLFDGAHLKDEVREKILEIVDKFTEDLEEDGIRIIIKDIVLIGSNVSYNYTKDSDLDIHIIADTSSLDCPHNLYPLLYSAYRSLFNKKFDINFYGIPVELFVEAGDVPTVSNGIYSVKDNDWVKVPDINTIPEYNKTALETSVDKWKAEAGQIISDIKTGVLEGEAAHDAIIGYVERIYELRKIGLLTTGEYGTENLTFKEIRNAGLLDELKDLKNEVTAKKLSLEAMQERLEERQRYDYAQILSREAHTQVILQSNGYFFIHNVKEQDVEPILAKLRYLDFVEYVRRGAAGKWDFSHVYPGALPTRYYTIEGKIKE